ncbi:MFS transporter [Actinomadura livida]|uniref:MFS family permease n=1 Tax=Actinomadura livida TaxID=79909 RepID=A0A7W7MV38_9ACTN|nr:MULTISPECIES: MFS transporter [Actinomadura]MBB4772221.1 MFS family permease [Actinomadura catellatispora]
MPWRSAGTHRPLIVSAIVAFAAFGAFWGAWGASVPRVQQQAGIGDGRLGFALLFVGAGALPAMLLAGRALDRWGLRVAAPAVAALGCAGAGVAVTAVNLAGLCAGLAAVGAASGAADVAMNAVAGRAEKIAGRPVITPAHGVFSALVVVASLGTGLASAASLPLAAPFGAVAVLSLVAGVFLLRTLRAEVVTARHVPAASASPSGRRGIVPFLSIGILGALAFASENAHQSWSAVFAQGELGSGDGLSAVAPAVFAGTVAITRFCVGGVKAAHARTVLLTGASAAATGAVLIAAAPTLPVAAPGLVLAAAGTAVLFPTLLGIVSRNVDESRRGRATSVVTTVSYLGFLAGPGYVGLWAEAAGLRGAMVAVAALAAVLLVLTPPLLRLPFTGTPLDGAPPMPDGRATMPQPPGPDLAERIARLEAVEEIKALKHRYLRACDAKDPAGFRACFIASGASIDFDRLGAFDDADGIAKVFERIALQQVDGRNAILDMHHAMHPDITVHGANSASGRWTLKFRQVNLLDGTETVSTGEYDDEYVVEDGRWKMSKCHFRRHWSITRPIGDDCRVDQPGLTRAV